MARVKTNRPGVLVQGTAPYDKPATRTAHIRAYLKSHPSPIDQRPSVVAMRLRSHGIDVSQDLVGKAKQYKRKGKNVKNVKNGQVKPVLSGQENTVEILLAAKALLEKAKNSQRAIEAIQILEALRVVE